MDEIERKFKPDATLIEHVTDHFEDSEGIFDFSTRINVEQAYLTRPHPNDAGEVELRVRESAVYLPSVGKEGVYYMMDVKVNGVNTIRRTEVSNQISKEDYERLSSNSRRRVIKKRYVYLVFGHRESDYTLEVDVFTDGLVLIEVEFDSVYEAREFDPPSWFGKEVTNDKDYLNRSLAERD